MARFLFCVAVAATLWHPSGAHGAPGSGNAAIFPAIDVAAGSQGTWSVVYSASDSFAVGGMIEVTIPAAWTVPQDTSTTTAGYLSVSTDQPDGNPVLAIASRVVTVTMDSLGVGHAVTLVYGDDAGGANPGAVATAQTLAEVGVTFLVASDPAGVAPTAIVTSPTVDVVPAAVTRLVFITTPFAFATDAEAGPLRVQTRDAFDNASPALSNQSIDLASTSAGASFSVLGGGGFSPVTSVTMLAGDDTVSFYYRDVFGGTPNITASAQAWTPAVQQQTVTGTRHVPTVLYPTIQSAIDSASVGDTIFVTAGSYSGTGNNDLDFGGKDLVLTSEDGAGATTIDCGGTNRAFTFDGGETSAAIVDGFTLTNRSTSDSGSVLNIVSAPTIRNCVISGNAVDNNGSAVEVSGAATFANCTLTGNTLGSSGASALLRVTVLSNAIFTDCHVDANTGGFSAFQPQTYSVQAPHGAHVDQFSASFFDGNYADISGGTFTNCTFSANTDSPAVRASGGTFNNCTISNNPDGALLVQSGAPVFVGCVMDSSSALPAPVYVQGGSPSFTNCEMSYNSGFSAGALWVGGGGAPEFITCHFERNGGPSTGAIDVHTSASFTGCEFTNNDGLAGAGAVWVADGSPTFAGCTIDSNSAEYCGGAVVTTPGIAVFDGCFITNNGTGDGAGGAYLFGGTSSNFSNCTFAGNDGDTGGGAYVVSSTASFSKCVFRGNASHFFLSGVGTGGAMWIHNPGPGTTLSDCLIAGNRASGEGGGVLVSGSGDVSLTGCTIAANHSNSVGGGGLYLGNDSDTTRVNLVETIVWNNSTTGTGDDVYVASAASVSFQGSIADTVGVTGSGIVSYLANNIYWDPLFCSPLLPAAAPTTQGDYTIASNSPATPFNSPTSAIIGADTVQCQYGNILSITDVGNDQGRQVRIEWNRAQWDEISAPDPIIQYSVWRKVLPGAAMRRPTSGKPATDIINRAPAGQWDFVQMVPASVQTTYITVVPTTCDSTIANGPCFSTFFVRAHTATPIVAFDCAPDSGYSIDNLVPAPPANFAVAYNTGGGNTLSWDANVEMDFQYYRVYRSTDPGFIPTSGDLVFVTSNTGWEDTGATTPAFHYRISAVDFAGNESAVSSPGTITAAADDSHPSQFALHANAPNPFNPTTTVVFDLPEPVDVSLQVYDVSGRLVRTLVDHRRMSAESHRVEWDGRADNGGSVASGVYFYRLRAGHFAESRKMVLMK